VARPWRTEYERALHHLLSRWNQRRKLFPDENGRLRFLAALTEMSERLRVDIFSYLLMPKHQHLLLRTNRSNLSTEIQKKLEGGVQTPTQQLPAGLPKKP
jgi:putative transposase